MRFAIYLLVTISALCVANVALNVCKDVATRRSDPLSYEEQKISMLMCILSYQHDRDTQRIEFENAVVNKLNSIEKHQIDNGPAISDRIYNIFALLSFIFSLAMISVWLIRTIHYLAIMRSFMYCCLCLTVRGYTQFKCIIPEEQDVIEYRKTISPPVLSKCLCCCVRLPTREDIEMMNM